MNCEGCGSAENILLMNTQDGLELLWDHVIKVQANNMFKELIKKVEEGIKGQTNQAACR